MELTKKIKLMTDEEKQLRIKEIDLELNDIDYTTYYGSINFNHLLKEKEYIIKNL